MRRREFLAGVGGAVAWSFAARAQRGERVRRIGVLFATAGTSEEDSLIETFQATLRSLGWIEGRNVELHMRLIGPLGEDTAQHAKELVGLKPDVLVAGPTSAVLALQRETQTIPIVFIGVSDERLVPNIARPDSNLTGFSTLALLVIGKGLQLFKEIARTQPPSLVAVMAGLDQKANLPTGQGGESSGPMSGRIATRKNRNTEES
jgi:putative tryptophan/tyrosine transport system substrate-binding protein